MSTTRTQFHASAPDDLVDDVTDESVEDDDTGLVIDHTSGITTTGYDKRAFDVPPLDDHPNMPPLPNDGYPDILGKFEQMAHLPTMAIKWGFPPLGLAVLLLSIIAFAGWHQPEKVVYHEVTVYCHDRGAAPLTLNKNPNAPSAAPTCHNRQVDLGTFLDLTRDQQAQILVAQGMLPIIIHSAFTIDSADTNNYNWGNFVLPYLQPNSQAATYLHGYLSNTVPAQIAANQTVAVRVDAPGDPAQPNTYTVGWINKISNGFKTKYQHITATITVTFGPKTTANQWGLYVTSIGIDQSGASNANDWNSLNP